MHTHFGHLIASRNCELNKLMKLHTNVYLKLNYITFFLVFSRIFTQIDVYRGIKTERKKATKSVNQSPLLYYTGAPKKKKRRRKSKTCKLFRRKKDRYQCMTLFH